jgi:nicotinamide-nucleotide amidase
MNAVIVSIGSELTSGLLVDTNSAFLSRELEVAGIEVAAHFTVGDEQPRIVAALRRACEQADVVIASGGLGPTPDDRTRAALAEAMGAELIEDERSFAEIEAFFRKRNYPMSRLNRVQAMRPAPAEAIPNANGTAPGIAAELGEAKVFTLPGVPGEMRAMFREHVLPRLGQAGRVILHRRVCCFGCGESSLAERIEDLMAARGDVRVGTTASSGLIAVHVSCAADSIESARRQADDILHEIRARLGEWIVAEGEDASLEAAVGELLRSGGQTLATAESCTGGMLGEMITAVPGSSEYYLGGVVSYTNAAKRDLLDVDAATLESRGAVSEAVARQMADGVRKRFAGDWGIGITGIAGPSGGTESKPVGLVFVALSDREGTHVERQIFPGDRQAVRRRAALTALNMLRKAMENL